MNKSHIRQTIIEQQEEDVANLQKAVDRFRNEADMDEAETHDPEDYSHQNEAEVLKKRMKEQLAIAEAELAVVKEISSDPCKTVKMGALVETDYLTFYVGISSLPFQHENKKVVGISTNAPIYFQLQDKKVGDKVTVGKQEYVIKAIS